jgi:hypothetical protein
LVSDYRRDLRLDLTAPGSLLKAARGKAASGLIVKVNGSFFQSGHHEGFQRAGLGFGISKKTTLL